MQVAEAPDPESVQVVNVPVLLVDSEMVPVGVMVGVGEASDTVTVQVTALLTGPEAGQLIPIELALSVDVTVPLVPLLVECTLSPW